jgi:hypothetical protein
VLSAGLSAASSLPLLTSLLASSSRASTVEEIRWVASTPRVKVRSVLNWLLSTGTPLKSVGNSYRPSA